MTEFETEGTVSLVVDERSLRQLRDDVEDIGPLSVGVDIEDGRAVTGGAAAATDGGTDYLSTMVDQQEEMVDLLEDIEGQGGLGGGSGGDGGGDFDLLSYLLGRGTGGGGGGLLSKLGVSGLLSGVSGALAGGGLAAAIADQLPAPDGSDRSALESGSLTFGLPLEGEGSIASFFTGAEAPTYGGDRATTAPGTPNTTNTPSRDQPSEEEAVAQEDVTMGSVEFANKDRELVQRLVKEGTIDADSTLAELARDENRTFRLDEETRRYLEQLQTRGEEETGRTNPDGGPATTGGTEISEEQRAIFNQTGGGAAGATGTGGVSGAVAVARNRAQEQRQQRQQGGETTVNVETDVSLKDLDRELEQVKRDVKRDIEREIQQITRR